MLWMLMTALWVVMLAAPLLLLATLLPTGRDCVRCGGETLPVQPRLLRPLRRFVLQRWCTSCGWEGYARSVAAPVPAPLEPALELTDEADDDAVWRGERHRDRTT